MRLRGLHDADRSLEDSIDEEQAHDDDSLQGKGRLTKTWRRRNKKAIGKNKKQPTNSNHKSVVHASAK